MKQVNKSEIVAEYLVCPFCWHPGDGLHECCGEIGHFEPAIETVDGELVFYRDVEVVE